MVQSFSATHIHPRPVQILECRSFPILDPSPTSQFSSRSSNPRHNPRFRLPPFTFSLRTTTKCTDVALRSGIPYSSCPPLHIHVGSPVIRLSYPNYFTSRSLHAHPLLGRHLACCRTPAMRRPLGSMEFPLGHNIHTPMVFFSPASLI